MTPSTLAARLMRFGFAFLSGHRPNASTDGAIARIGHLVSIQGLDSIQVLTPKPVDTAPPNIYSGNYGLEEFPLHTDLAHWGIPPRYLVLRCVVGSPDVGTYLVDGRRVVAAAGADALRRALVQPRRPLGGTRPLLRLLERAVDRQDRLRWDQLYLRPATEASRSTFESVAAYLRACRRRRLCLAERGDTLVIDNWRMLHGRSGVSESGRGRRIERAYLGGLL